MATHFSILAWRIHGQRSLVSYSPWGLKESDTTVTELNLEGCLKYKGYGQSFQNKGLAPGERLALSRTESAIIPGSRMCCLLTRSITNTHDTTSQPQNTDSNSRGPVSSSLSSPIPLYKQPPSWILSLLFLLKKFFFVVKVIQYKTYYFNHT